MFFCPLLHLKKSVQRQCAQHRFFFRPKLERFSLLIDIVNIWKEKWIYKPSAISWGNIHIGLQVDYSRLGSTKWVCELHPDLISKRDSPQNIILLSKIKQYLLDLITIHFQLNSIKQCRPTARLVQSPDKWPHPHCRFINPVSFLSCFEADVVFNLFWATALFYFWKTTCF